MFSSSENATSTVISEFPLWNEHIVLARNSIVASVISEAQCLNWRFIMNSTCLIILLFGMTQLVTLATSTVVLRKKGLKEPPVLPYSVPLLGHTLFFMWDVFALFTSIT